MKKILEIEFEENITIDEIFEELLHYKKIGQIVFCIFQGKLLSNEDVDKLKVEVEKIKLKMTEEEHKEQKQIESEKENLSEQEKKEILRFITASLTVPSIIRYYIERAKTVIDESKWDEWEEFCCFTIYNYEKKENDKQKIWLNKTIISAVKIMLVLNTAENESEIYKVIDTELSDIEYDYSILELRYVYFENIISKFTDKGELYKKLICHDKINEPVNKIFARKKTKLNKRETIE